MAGTEQGVRDRVLAAAVDLFAGQGYDATSIAQVTERAQVARGGFYHHFASKQELLAEVYGDLIHRQLAGMERILAERAAPAVTLRALILDLVESTAGSARQALIYFRETAKLGGDQGAEIARARRRYHDAVITLVRQAQATGQFRSVASAEIVTFAVFGVINELPLWYRSTGPKRPDQIAGELADLVLAALEVRR